MRKITSVLLLTLLCMLLSGCWSKKELNEIAIVVALGIDQKGDEFEVTVQIVNPGEISSKQPTSGRSPVSTYSATGSTVFEAIRKVTLLAPRKSYFSHLQIVVLGSELTESGIKPVLDLLTRDHEFRNDFTIIAANETTAKNIISVLTPVEKIPANKIAYSLKISEKAWGSTVTVTMSDIITLLHGEENSLVLSTLELIGNKQAGMSRENVDQIVAPAALKYSGLAVIKQGKKVGQLTDEESTGYNFLTDNITSSIMQITCPNGGNLATEITHTKTTVKGKIDKDIPKIHVSVDVQQNVGEVHCVIDLTTEQAIMHINEETSVVIKQKMEKTLYALQKKYQADAVHFNKILHQQEARKWKNIKDQWATIFPDVEVVIDVVVHTRNSGTTQNSTFFLTKE
ncbi:Ger(x)C family spore germination protein [Metasolibacillus meyeri]|uniref:Ger(X)C family spore germination protein n=1 Tax=Metasolibacillus meyeri TaxID=1071052 RepID=A0AAW9NXA9_9BACL|nr:Ger(x)C family spore germination protein [Metasolibacillus meyeri]MEC1180309.1 Ger(x)C family spore germination protein [Metasolibacillus meyeri]